MNTRMYGPLWTKLKNEKSVSITANRLHHPRILKAVTKEKWLDLEYKMEISPKIAQMSTTSRGAVLTFYLSEKVPLTEIWRYV